MSTQPISFKKFPAELYRRIKVEAAKRDVTVFDIFVQALREHLVNGKRVKQ